MATAGGVLSRTATGAAAGAPFGPWGAAIGGGIGLVSGLFDSGGITPSSGAGSDAALQAAQAQKIALMQQALKMTEAYRPQIAHARQEAMNNRLGAYQGAANALQTMYGGGHGAIPNVDQGKRASTAGVTAANGYIGNRLSTLLPTYMPLKASPQAQATRAGGFNPPPGISTLTPVLPPTTSPIVTGQANPGLTFGAGPAAFLPPIESPTTGGGTPPSLGGATFAGGPLPAVSGLGPVASARGFLPTGILGGAIAPGPGAGPSPVVRRL